MLTFPSGHSLLFTDILVLFPYTLKKQVLYSFRLGSSPSQEKSRERRTWDICSILNVTCKNL
jgi:hypothetical protein